MNAKEMYNVVFRGAGKNGNYPGVMTWTSFVGKKEFDQWLLEGHTTDEVVAAGVTQDEAVDIVRHAPVEPSIGLALRLATEGGEFNQELFDLKMANLAMMEIFYPDTK